MKQPCSKYASQLSSWSFTAIKLLTPEHKSSQISVDMPVNIHTKPNYSSLCRQQQQYTVHRPVAPAACYWLTFLRMLDEFHANCLVNQMINVHILLGDDFDGDFLAGEFVTSTVNNRPVTVSDAWTKLVRLRDVLVGTLHACIHYFDTLTTPLQQLSVKWRYNKRVRMAQNRIEAGRHNTVQYVLKGKLARMSDQY